MVTVWVLMLFVPSHADAVDKMLISVLAMPTLHPHLGYPSRLLPVICALEFVAAVIRI